MAIRKNIANLTPEEKSEFIAAILELKRIGKYDEYVLVHAKAPMVKIHRGPAFLTWHRQLLLEFEQDLQAVSGNPDLGLPYWHWGQNAALENPADYPMWADDFFGGNGDLEDGSIVKTGPLRQGEWTIVDMMGNPDGPLIRAFGESPLGTTLPSNHQIARVLEMVPFDSAPWTSNSRTAFRNHLEGWVGGQGAQMHNRCHMWIGGSMIPMTSPNDPVFFLHHCFVDKLWWDWTQLHPDQTPYGPEWGAEMGHNLDDFMLKAMRGNPQNSSMLDIEALGYSYDRRESMSELIQGEEEEQAPGDGGVVEMPGHEGHDMTGGDGEMPGHDDHEMSGGDGDMPGHDDHDMSGGDGDMSGHDDHDMSGDDGDMADTDNEETTDLPTTGTGGRTPKASGKGCMVMLSFLLILISLIFS